MSVAVFHVQTSCEETGPFHRRRFSQFPPFVVIDSHRKGQQALRTQRGNDDVTRRDNGKLGGTNTKQLETNQNRFVSSVFTSVMEPRMKPFSGTSDLSPDPRCRMSKRVLATAKQLGQGGGWFGTTA